MAQSLGPMGQNPPSHELEVSVGNGSGPKARWTDKKNSTNENNTIGYVWEVKFTARFFFCRAYRPSMTPPMAQDSKGTNVVLLDQHDMITCIDLNHSSKV